MNIFTIIIIILLIGLILGVIEWIHDNFIYILIIAAVMVGLIFFRKITLIILAICAGLFALVMIFRFVVVPIYVALSRRIKDILNKCSDIREKRKIEKEEYEKQRREKKEDESRIAVLPEKVKAFLQKSQEFMDELDVSCKSIRDTNIKQKVLHGKKNIEMICTEVKRTPASYRRLDKLIDYYYPTLCKLVAKYSVYENRKDEGDVKAEIANAIDAINDALGKVVENVIEYDNIDVLTDISVVKQMIDMDGLK